MKEPASIIHVITSLNLGGAETMLCQVLEHTDRTKFSPVVVSLRPEAALGSRVRAAGVPLHCLNMDASPAHFLPGLRKLKAIMREVQPAVVQTWMYHADLLGALAARSLKPRVPVLWNIQHGTMDPRTTKRASLWLTRMLAPLSRWLPDRITVCSRASIETHAQLGYARSKMLHIPNGADCARFIPDPTACHSIRSELGIPQNAPVIGMAGRNDPQKDYPTLFAAIREFQKSDKTTHFVACGNRVSPNDPELAALRAQCSAPERIHLLGARFDMPRVYAAFDLVTLSSAYGEGMPVTLCEALACGLPAVVTNVGDSASVIGSCGKVVSPRNPTALAAAWGELLVLPKSAFSKMEKDARKRAEQQFSLPEITRNYERLHSELIAASQQKTRRNITIPYPCPAV